MENTNSNIDYIKNDIMIEAIKKLQKAEDASMYTKKSPTDKIKCIVCGGKYTRRQKSTHDKTNKHIKKVDEFIEKINK